MPSTGRTYVFTGSHSGMVTGARYTLSEVSTITELNNATVHSRMAGMREITNAIVKPRTPDGRWVNSRSQLATSGERLSAQWLAHPISSARS